MDTQISIKCKCNISNFNLKDQYQKLLDQMLTEEEKNDPENGEKAINVLKYWAQEEEEKKAGEHKTHFIRDEEEIVGGSVKDKISKKLLFGNCIGNIFKCY